MEMASSSFTAFDVVVIAVLFVSAVMSLSRGLIREASSILSFVAGGAAAYTMLLLFRDQGREILPDTITPLVSDAILVVFGFLVAYILAAWIGGQVSKLIHSSPEIGTLDRIAGAVFGAARGGLAVILFVLLMQMMVHRDSTPGFIANSKTYPYADSAASWLRDHFPAFMRTAQDAIPPIEANGQ